MLDIHCPDPERTEPLPSLNHSYICIEIIKQLLANQAIQALPELTLEIDNGLTPDISVFPKAKIKPNFFRDIVKFKEMPILAIEVISPQQNIQDVLEKAPVLIHAGVKVVWTVEPYGRTVFVSTEAGETIFHEERVETEGIRVDFSKIFNLVN